MEQYKEALLREIDARRAFLMRCAEPATLYIGGGTPSLCPVEWLAEIISAVRNAGGKAGELSELTVEVNPDDVTPEYALGLRGLGVNRVSMGVQSFSDVSLRWMNRRHTAAGAREAYRMLREAGFGNISLDLIFGYDPVPWGAPTTPRDLLMQQWREDLEQMLLLRPEHISAYQMGVEEDSVLGEKSSAGLYRGPSDELCAAQYALLQQMLSEAGYEQYEVSNFALPGRQAIHNSGYWERLPYIGLGPGAAAGCRRCLPALKFRSGLQLVPKAHLTGLTMCQIPVRLPAARLLPMRMCWSRKSCWACARHPACFCPMCRNSIR